MSKTHLYIAAAFVAGVFTSVTVKSWLSKAGVNL